MRTRRLGYTELELTCVGLGTWAMGGPWQFGWGPQDDNDAIKSILESLDNGINWIDTAAVYGCGHAEELVGKALKQTPRKPLIATKCGLLWNEKREKVSCLKYDSVIRECHDSLKRLGIDVIDLYQIHWGSPDEDIEEAWEAMAALQEQGKVRYIGVSNFSVSQIQRCRKVAPVASLQPPYSMLHREVEQELLGFCAENDIGVVVYSPMQRGLLTGKFDHKRLASLPEDDHRKRQRDFQEPEFSATLELVGRLKEIADQSGKTCAQLAVAWVLRRSEVTSAIVGARKPGQISETAPAADWVLTGDEIEQIEQLLAQRQQRINRG
jgi:aryl-alcohol dehydrogenase-like predicted oxidoreductase